MLTWSWRLRLWRPHRPCPDRRTIPPNQAGQPDAATQALRQRLAARASLVDQRRRLRNRISDPEAKGLVERANRYLETSSLPGRRFSSLADFNRQLAEWLPRANSRHHRTTDYGPLDRIAEDRAAMLPLPPVLPDPAFRTTTRLARDHYVRVLGSDYSVAPWAIGRRVEIRVDLECVTVHCAGQLVARHARSLVHHRVVTDAGHVLARARLRDERSIALVAQPVEVEVRDLHTYDEILGVAL